MSPQETCVGKGGLLSHAYADREGEFVCVYCDRVSPPRNRTDRLKDFLAELNDLQRKHQIQIDISEWISIHEYNVHQWTPQFDWKVKDESQFIEFGEAELVRAP